MYPYPDMFNQNRYQNNDYFNRTYNQQPIEQPVNNLIRVTGIDGAKAYQMPANSSVALFDNNNDYMYVKTTDGAGFPTIRTFKFEEIQPNQIGNITEDNDYISREEFEQFKKEMMEYGKQFIQRSKSNLTTDKSADN